MTSAPHIPAAEATVVIRVATPVDRDELALLAELDSARPLTGSVLVAQSDGRIRAAYAIEEDRAIADPFRPTAGLVELLRTRTAMLQRHRRAAIRPRRPRLAAARP